jgi:hypothetical protein
MRRAPAPAAVTRFYDATATAFTPQQARQRPQQPLTPAECEAGAERNIGLMLLAMVLVFVLALAYAYCFPQPYPEPMQASGPASEWREV